jgi:hypothetical protein
MAGKGRILDSPFFRAASVCPCRARSPFDFAHATLRANGVGERGEETPLVLSLSKHEQRLVLGKHIHNSLQPSTSGRHDLLSRWTAGTGSARRLLIVLFCLTCFSAAFWRRRRFGGIFLLVAGLFPKVSVLLVQTVEDIVTQRENRLASLSQGK